MNIEEQLRDYRTALDAATEEAAASNDARVAPPVHTRPARTLVFAAVAVAAAVAIAFLAVGASHNRSTRPASGDESTTVAPTAAPPTTIGPGSRTVVPDVVGMQSAEAVTTLGRFGYIVQQTLVSQCVAPPGTVVTSDPAPGTHVAAATRVTIGVCPPRS
jgi:hypothetical protein